MATSGITAPMCNSNGGRGIGAGHVCRCIRMKGHPIDSDRPHGCSCMALWADPSDEENRESEK